MAGINDLHPAGQAARRPHRQPANSLTVQMRLHFNDKFVVFAGSEFVENTRERFFETDVDHAALDSDDTARISLIFRDFLLSHNIVVRCLYAFIIKK